MTDKVQKIRKEVEKLFNHVKDSSFESDSGAFYYFKDLLDFIDSLQEEPKPQFKVGDIIRDKVWELAVHEIVSMDDGAYYFENGGMVRFDDQELWELAEEPVNEVWHDGCENPKSGTNILMIRKEKEDSNFPPIAGRFYGTDLCSDGIKWGYYNGFCYNEIEPPVKWVYIDDILNLSNVERIEKDWIEMPVGKDLEKAANKYIKGNYSPWLYKAMFDCFKAGAKWKESHLWKPADGDDLPDIDKEVIVLTQPYPNDEHLRVAFAHRTNKYTKIWNSDLGEEQVVEIERYDKGGWNIPDVKWWLDCNMDSIFKK